MSDWQTKVAQNLRAQLGVMGRRAMPSGRDGFDDELDSLRALDYKVRCTKDEFYSASLGSNISKNRFRDVLPNEGTRVILDAVNERGDGDYINANYIDARRIFGVPFVYIATQAPMRNTVFDFWRMVFENNVVFVVMLCNEIESGKVKSERYWPDSPSEPISIGPLTVELVSENLRADSVFRTIALRTSDGKERMVQHMQYTKWPDQSIPQSSGGLMEVISSLGKTQLSTQTPIVVHCSGGVGRTGVFITLHVALALFQLEQPVSIPRIVQFLKYCRSGMVQRKDQYLFCYYAVLREMERMLWTVNSKRDMNSKISRTAAAAQAIQQDSERELPNRRQSEHRPRHAAQSQPPIFKSSLRGSNAWEEFQTRRSDDGGADGAGQYGTREFAFGASRGGAAAPTASTFAYSRMAPPAGTVDSASFNPAPVRGNRREYPTYVRPIATEWAAAASTDPDELDRALADLQRANQGRRQTPSRMNSVSRYDEPQRNGSNIGAPRMQMNGGDSRRLAPLSSEYRPEHQSMSGDPHASPVAFASPAREPSQDRSEVGIRATTPDLPRYSAQPLTPSEGGFDRASPARGSAAAAPAARPLTGAAAGGGIPLRAAMSRDEDFDYHRGANSRPLPSQRPPPAAQGRSDVEAAIGDFDAAMFSGVRRQDPNLL